LVSPQPEPFLYSGAFGGRRALPSAFRSRSFDDELKCIVFIISACGLFAVVFYVLGI